MATWWDAILYEFASVLAARRSAVEAAGEDAAAVERAEGAFRRLVSAAEERFKSAALAEGADAEAHYQYGNFLQTTELFQEAEEEYIRALELDKAHVDAMNNLATLRLTRDDDPEGARFIWEQALKVAPEDVDVMFNIAEAARQQGDEGCVSAMLERILASVGLGWDDAYVTNLVKRRPPQNRDPTPEEVAFFAPWAFEEVRLVVLVGEHRGRACGVVEQHLWRGDEWCR